jgi:two-component system response regulator HupR/HoxA
MKIVVIDDEAANVAFLQRALKAYTLECFTDPQEAIQYCRTHTFDLIIADQKMPGITGIELIKRVQEETSDFIALIISAYTDTRDLIDAVNSNLIYRYIIKPFTPEQLTSDVEQARETLTLRREEKKRRKLLQLENQRLLEENQKLKSNTNSSLDFFIGFAPAIQYIRDQVQMYARSEEPVLIYGETGTGKEIVARAIHELSERATEHFIPVNCSAFSESLIESELFGHEKGAFTGATRAKTGLVEAANGGTIFLDEVGDLRYGLQAKLLRFLQFGSYYPVGSVDERSVNVRVLAATNKDLGEAMQKNTFRKDLYYRLSSLSIDIPPLRNRKEDILPIIDFIADKKGYTLFDFSDEAKEFLLEYNYPGNIRELEGLVEKIHLHTQAHEDKKISREMISDFLVRGKSANRHTVRNAEVSENEHSEHEAGELHLQEYIDTVEKKIITEYLLYYNGNVSRTANALHMSRQGLKNKINRFDILIPGKRQ